MPTIKCPDCFKEYNLNIKLSGKKGECKNCGEKFIINFEDQSIESTNEYKENYNIKENKKCFKIIKFIKYLFILLFSLLTILLIIIYISSLNSYKKNDFNIPQDAFQTKFGDKDPYSEENGFTDLVNFINALDSREDLPYFNTLSKCIFDNEYIKNGNCEKDKQWYISTQKMNIKSEILLRMKQDLETNTISSDENQQYRKIFYEKGNFTSIDIQKYPKLEEYMNFETIFKKNTEEYFNEYKRFIHVKNISSNKIQSKEYILQTDEYSAAYDSEKPYNGNNNYYGGGKTIIYTSLIQFSRGLNYVVYKYFEDGDYDAGIKLLIEHQNFIDNLTNKTDADLMNALVNISLSKTNLEALDYILDNYELSEKQKNNIQNSLGNQVDEGLVQNSLKREHIINRTIFEYLYDSSLRYDDNGLFSHLKGLIEMKLFYSVEESELISDKYAYSHIYDNLKWSCPVNLNNYIGRTLACNLSITYEKQYQKEENIKILRENILKKLQGSKKPQ